MHTKAALPETCHCADQLSSRFKARSIYPGDQVSSFHTHPCNTPVDPCCLTEVVWYENLMGEYQLRSCPPSNGFDPRLVLRILDSAPLMKNCIFDAVTGEVHHVGISTAIYRNITPSVFSQKSLFPGGSSCPLQPFLGPSYTRSGETLATRQLAPRTFVRLLLGTLGSLLSTPEQVPKPYSTVLLSL